MHACMSVGITRDMDQKNKCRRTICSSKSANAFGEPEWGIDVEMVTGIGEWVQIRIGR